MESLTPDYPRDSVPDCPLQTEDESALAQQGSRTTLQ